MKKPNKCYTCYGTCYCDSTLMGNHRMGNYQTWITSTSPRVSEVAIVEIQK
jgi:hypothetical protein